MLSKYAIYIDFEWRNQYIWPFEDKLWPFHEPNTWQSPTVYAVTGQFDREKIYVIWKLLKNAIQIRNLVGFE